MTSVLALLALVAITALDASGASPHPLGTFSNLEYHQLSGDLAGFEIKIVPTARGYQGALLIAEGMPGEIIVVSVTVQRDQIRFTVPTSYESYGGTSFSGTFDGTSIRGRFLFRSGTIEDVVLSKCGYWDSPSCPAAAHRAPPTPKMKR